MSGRAVRDRRLRSAQDLWTHRGAPRRDLEVAEGEVFGLSGRTARARRRRSRSSRATALATEATATVLGHDPGAAPRGASRTHRRRPPAIRAQPRSLPFARRTACSPATTRSPRDVDEVIELVGLGEKRDRARQDTVWRPEAATRPRRRARRQPRARVPRRADDGFRPGGTSSRLGHDPLAPLARHDDPADDALPRRGAAAGGSRGGAPERRDRAHGHAGRAHRRLAD